MQKNVPHEGIRLPKQETFPKGFAAQAAGSYTAELEARDSNSHPCSLPSPIPAQTKADEGATKTRRILR